VAAPVIVHDDDQWIAYDDRESVRTKVCVEFEEVGFLKKILND